MSPSWRDNMGPASFRGIPFFVDVAQLKTGRRTVKHVFPKRDKAFFEDMGRAARVFPVEGYVIGNDYLKAKEALLAEVEKEGPGELIHPYYGTLKVICSSDCTVRESKGEGGWAQFSLEFEETDAASEFPSAKVDAAASVVASSKGAIAAITSSFTAAFSIASLPAAALNTLAGVVSSAAAELDRLLTPLVTAGQALATFKSKVTELRSSARSLVTAPGDLIASFVDVLSLLTPPDPRTAVDGLLAAYDFDPGERPPATTPRRIIEQRSWDATRNMIRGLAVTQATSLAVAGASSFVSYEDATAVLEQITEKIDGLLDVSDDVTFQAVTQLRADLVKALPGDAADLPRLIATTPNVTLPSLVIAWNLYGELDAEADLLARNHVRHPAFVPGGVRLEVLSRA